MQTLSPRIGVPPIQTSDIQFAKAIAPKSSGSSTIGEKTSIV
ncbi:MAG: hypothetical protein R2883_07730 [Caldisericia bacterium]